MVRVARRPTVVALVGGPVPDIEADERERDAVHQAAISVGSLLRPTPGVEECRIELRLERGVADALVAAAGRVRGCTCVVLVAEFREDELLADRLLGQLIESIDRRQTA